jgi:drug/metabolite transporter (DMT)-like permease
MPLNYDLKTEFLRYARTPVPAILGMAVVLALFNADSFAWADIAPKLAVSVTMALVMCAFGLAGLYVGLKTALSTQDQVKGWLAGAAIGFAGIVFLLWFYAEPSTPAAG